VTFLDNWNIALYSFRFHQDIRCPSSAILPSVRQKRKIGLMLQRQSDGGVHAQWNGYFFCFENFLWPISLKYLLFVMSWISAGILT
jgi:hypothetical protein